MRSHSFIIAAAAALLAPATSLPVGPRLLNVSPEISPKADLTDPAVSCVGIAACNPVVVNDHAGTPSSSSSQPQQTPPSSQPNGSGSGGGSLVNVAPVVSPDVSLSGLVDCVGIATCNPVTVTKGDGSS